MININILKKVRETKGLSQTELAYKAGITPRYIAFIESGDRNPSLKVAKKIADILNSTVDDIFLNNKCTKCTYKED